MKYNYYTIAGIAKDSVKVYRKLNGNSLEVYSNSRGWVKTRVSFYSLKTLPSFNRVTREDAMLEVL